MKLSNIMKATGCLKVVKGDDVDVSSVSIDSRLVKKNGVFIAIQGYSDNGLKYIDDAVRRGAKTIIVEEKSLHEVVIPKGVTLCSTLDSRECALLMASYLAGKPSNKLFLIGVTGTNGKTTVTYILEKILTAAGYNPGVIGTITYRYGSKVVKADTTTPDPVNLQNMLSEMAEAGVTHVIIEVSSHALEMKRVNPSEFRAAIFTNLTQDHLDFHGTMENYFNAKSILFRYLGDDALSVININDPYGKKMVGLSRGKLVTYGVENGSADYLGKYESLTLEGSVFYINSKKFRTKLLGVHNIYNILAAYSLLDTVGVDHKVISEVLKDFTNVPGRFERVWPESGYYVFVDYAHTPDALEHLISTAQFLKSKQLSGGRVITVFGCGGDRDRKKRPKMGRIAEELSDFVIVTSDNPRTEEPISIIKEIKSGMKGNNNVVIPDRKEAIYRAVEMINPEDILLIAGKGHEDYQIIGKTKIHFDDREVARAALEEKLKGN